jgi:hypothetical protein
MASAAQILSNRVNAQSSTGPQTEAGKQRSSLNSFKHGLTSSKVVLPGEDPAEYDAFRAGILEECAPANSTEQILAEELSAAGWRLNRARAVETEVLKKLMGEKASSNAALATVFLEKPKEFERLQRYLTSIERAYYRALNKLEKLQKERRAEEYKAAVERAWLARQAQAAAAEAEAAEATEDKPLQRKLASFRQGKVVPQLTRFQLLKARRQANRKAAAA